MPTSVRTMWRRKLSASISSSRCSPRSAHSARRRGGRKSSCCVSVGVNARKSCSPDEQPRPLVQRLHVQRPGHHQLRRASNGERSAGGGCGTDTNASARSGARGSPRAPRTGNHGHVVGQLGVQGGGSAIRGRAARDVDADDLAERVHARVRPPGHRERLDGAVERAQRPAQLTLHRAQSRLGRPAAEGGSVVLELERQSHQRATTSARPSTSRPGLRHPDPLPHRTAPARAPRRRAPGPRAGTE